MPINRFDDIIPPSRRREQEPLAEIRTNAKESYQSSGHSPRFPYATMLIVLLIVAASAGTLYYFASAKIQVVPNSVTAAVQNTYKADVSGALPFKVISAQKVASQSVKGNGTKTVSTLATGSITIYNTQSKAQTLVAKTRFSTTGGLIFRIQSSVTVPAGTEAKPGTVVAKVSADKAGSNYNIGPSSFSIPGFTGTPQADKVYARSGVLMSGGASGTVPVVDAGAAGPTRRALIAALAPDLTASIQPLVPPGYVLLPGAATTTYQELDATPSATAGMVDLKEQGTITAVVFANASLAKAIASSMSGLNYQGEPLTLASSTSLVLVPSGAMPESDATSFDFSLSGNVTLMYTVDESRIAAAVAGKTRSAAEVALTSYPEVKQAVIVLRPFWKQTFPDDPASIKVIVNNP